MVTTESFDLVPLWNVDLKALRVQKSLKFASWGCRRQEQSKRSGHLEAENTQSATGRCVDRSMLAQVAALSDRQGEELVRRPGAESEESCTG